MSTPDIIEAIQKSLVTWAELVRYETLAPDEQTAELYERLYLENEVAEQAIFNAIKEGVKGTSLDISHILEIEKCDTRRDLYLDKIRVRYGNF